jgi:transcriptional regulator with GAF, ATPase, and Fis domain
MMNDLMSQLKAVIDENRKLEEKVKQLEEEKQQEYEATCKAKDQVVELLNEKAEMERLFNEIERMAKR